MGKGDGKRCLGRVLADEIHRLCFVISHCLAPVMRCSTGLSSLNLKSASVQTWETNTRERQSQQKQ